MSRSAGLARTISALSRTSGTMSTEAEENPPPLAAPPPPPKQQVAHQAAAQVAERRPGHFVHQSAAARRTAAEDRRQHVGDVRRLGILQIEHRVVAGRAAVAFGHGREQFLEIVERFEVVRGDQHAARARARRRSAHPGGSRRCRSPDRRRNGAICAK